MSEIQPSEMAKIVHDTRNTAQAAQAALELANTNPTNADLKDAIEAGNEEFHKHASADGAFQDMQIGVNEGVTKSLESIHKRLGELPDHQDTAKIVETVIRDLLLSKGKLVYQGIIGASILIGALIVIFGGFKTVVGWLGFSAIIK